MKIGIKSEKVIIVPVIDQELADAYAGLVDMISAGREVELDTHHEIIRLVATKLASGSTVANLKATLSGVEVKRGKPQFLASHVQFATSVVVILDTIEESHALSIKELITLARRAEAVGGKAEVGTLVSGVESLKALEAVAPPLKAKGREASDKPKFKTATELVEWAADQMTKYDDIDITNNEALAKLSGILAKVAAKHRNGERRVA